MFPILLLILKIIGIVILVLLGLLLLALLLILFVPVRYSLSGSFYGKWKGQAKVTWLLYVVSIGVTYEENFDIAVRVLGKRLFQKKMRKEKAQEELKDGLKEVKRDMTEAAEELYEPIIDSEMPELGSEWKTKQSEDRVSDGQTDIDEEFSDYENDSIEQNLEKKILSQDQDMVIQEVGGGSRQTKDKKKSKKKKKKRKSKSQNPSSEKKIPIWERRNQTANSWKETWNRLQEYKGMATAFWNDEKNQKTIKLIIRQIKAMMIHILPRKAKGKVLFGFDDPATTGKVLEAFSLVYVWYGDAIEIVPVFDRKLLEAEGSLKGRVRAGTIAAHGFRILLNKNFRVLVKRWLKNGGR